MSEMSAMTSLPSLIAELASAPGPSRELDARIALAVKAAPVDAFRPCASSDPGEFGTGAYRFWKAPEYTRSLDAAMSLVPGGWTASRDMGGTGQAECAKGLAQYPYIATSAATPALALCIAALKARARSQEPGTSEEEENG